MAKAKRTDGAAARGVLSEAEMNLLIRLVNEERLYVVPAKAQKPRKVASASLTAGGRAVLLYQSKMPTELP
jgi:hypothetical protein